MCVCVHNGPNRLATQKLHNAHSPVNGSVTHYGCVGVPVFVNSFCVSERITTMKDYGSFYMLHVGIPLLGWGVYGLNNMKKNIFFRFT